MNQKGTVKKYITPHPWPLIVSVVGYAVAIPLSFSKTESLYLIGGFLCMFLVLPLIAGLFQTLPGFLRASGTVKRLKKEGLLDMADAELASGQVTELCKRKAACTEHFLFARRGAFALEYTDILWAYKHKLTQTLLFIPIHTTESVILCTKKKNYSIKLVGKDKNNELVELIKLIYQHNPKTLVGFTKENQQTYKQLRKTR